MDSCIFCDIVQGNVPCEKVYETDRVLAFRDINPVAPIHIQIIPKEHIASLARLDPDKHRGLAGDLQLAAGEIARQLGVADEGFRVVTNIGARGGQSVDHLHYHLLAGRDLAWPPG